MIFSATPGQQGRQDSKGYCGCGSGCQVYLVSVATQNVGVLLPVGFVHRTEALKIARTETHKKQESRRAGEGGNNGTRKGRKRAAQTKQVNFQLRV